MRDFKFVILAMMLLALAACEDKITSSCEDDVQLSGPAKFSDIQAQIFNAHCTSCHSGSTPTGDLNLSSGKAYTNLVNVISTSSSLSRVKPGDSGNSYLIHRLEELNGESIMPPTGNLAASHITLIVKWIDEGAQNN